MSTTTTSSNVHVVEIINKYREGDVFLYHKLVNLCGALNAKTHTELAITDFLHQCSEHVVLLAEDQSPLTEALIDLCWFDLFPSSVDVLAEIYVQLALTKIDLLPTIIHALLRNFVWCTDNNDIDPVTSELQSGSESQPTTSTNDSNNNGDITTSTAVSINDHVSTTTHACIERLVLLMPGLSDKHGYLFMTLRRTKPHISAPTSKIRLFIQNAMCMSAYIPTLSETIWSECIVDTLLFLDVQVSQIETKQEEADEDRDMFMMDMDEKTKEGETVLKLDLCMTDVLCFIDKTARGEIVVRTSFDADTVAGSSDWLFDVLYPVLVSNVLLTLNSRHVTYIWFMLCAYDKNILDRLLHRLWLEVEQPDRVSSRRAHAAVCFMASILARAKYVTVSLCRVWLERWLSWAWSYYDECMQAGRASTDGRLSHGTFYAVAHAVMFVFNYRCKQMLNDKMIGLNVMQSWHFDRLCHCSLNPLRYVDPHVVHVFASICRTMQLAYCQHIIERNKRLDRNKDEQSVPFEASFPFEPYRLQTSHPYIAPLYLEFTVLADVSCDMTTAEHQWNEMVKQRQRTNSVVDDFIIENTDIGSPSPHSLGNNHVGSVGELLALGDYGTSPGFRHTVRVDSKERN